MKAPPFVIGIAPQKIASIKLWEIGMHHPGGDKTKSHSRKAVK
jgi:hypothetical protein